MRLIRVHIALLRVTLARWHGDKRERHLAAVERYLKALEVK